MKFGACLGIFGQAADRFCRSGYGPKRTLDEMFEATSRVKGLAGVELVSNWHVKEDNVAQVKKTLEKHHLEACMMVPDLWTQSRWGKGSFASKDKKIRQAAVKEVKKVMDLSAEIGCDKVDVWLGQDGFDYSFQADYLEDWGNIIECTRECAAHRSDIKICIEYKLKEPRIHCYVNSAAKALLLINEVQKDNVGILLDVGHAIVAQENPAEAAALISRNRGKLFYIHLNDNYRYWDDDMMVGSVNIPMLLEFMHWLNEIGYDDYYTLDIFPYREDSIKAVAESIEWIKTMKKMISKIGRDKIREVIAGGDATQSLRMLREAIL
ncbi:MAG: sugar phosphate isomerase/epimerase [Chloroflexi bacterium]|nr:sugar phosphate isomerase/epimerase [Chloroflexota bacterium]